MTFYFFYNIIIVQVRYIIIESTKSPVLDKMGFFSRIRAHVKALVLRTSDFTWVLMRKKETRYIQYGLLCFHITVSYA